MMNRSLSADMLLCSNDRAIISSSILRDVKLVLVSFVATCIIIFMYNYRLQQRCDEIMEKAKVRWFMLQAVLMCSFGCTLNLRLLLFDMSILCDD